MRYTWYIYIWVDLYLFFWFMLKLKEKQLPERKEKCNSYLNKNVFKTKLELFFLFSISNFYRKKNKLKWSYEYNVKFKLLYKIMRKYPKFWYKLIWNNEFHGILDMNHNILEYIYWKKDNNLKKSYFFELTNLRNICNNLDKNN